MFRKRHEEVVLTLPVGRGTLAYRVWLEEVCGGWLVLFAEGRVGTTLAVQEERPNPLPRDAALAILHSLVVEKTKRGYRARSGQQHREACCEIRRVGRRVVGF